MSRLPVIESSRTDLSDVHVTAEGLCKQHFPTALLAMITHCNASGSSGHVCCHHSLHEPQSGLWWPMLLSDRCFLWSILSMKNCIVLSLHLPKEEVCFDCRSRLSTVPASGGRRRCRCCPAASATSATRVSALAAAAAAAAASWPTRARPPTVPRTPAETCSSQKTPPPALRCAAVSVLCLLTPF